MSNNARYRNPQAVDKALVQGVGGLQFTAQSPGGIGRLCRIPFYCQAATPGFAAGIPGDSAVAMTAALVAGRASAVSPIIFFDPANLAAAGASGTVTLFTPQISWASLRIVGFEVTQSQVPVPAAPPAKLCVSDFQIGGGANLFVHEDFGDAGIYDWQNKDFAGLRDNPVLNSPNQAQVDVQVVGVPASPRIRFECNLVAEVLVDDQFGAHIPGPYARRGAMVRAGGGLTV